MTHPLLRCSLFLSCLAAAAVAQYRFFVPNKTPSITAERFAETANHLVDRDVWRYGFVLGHHGAFLVRTLAAGAAPTRCPVMVDPCSEELEGLMADELDGIPRLAALELAGYALLLAFVVLVLPGAMVWLLRRTPKRLRMPVLGFAAAAAVITLFLVPYATIGYGGSAFTNWVGPGAFSYSGGYFWWPHTPGLTVSYRMVLEAVFYRPGTVFGNLGSHLPMPEMPMWLFLWLLGVLFYGTVLWAVAVVAQETRRIAGVFGPDGSGSIQVRATTRQLTIWGIAVVAFTSTLVIQALQPGWQGLPPWVVVLCLTLALPVAVTSVVRARRVRGGDNTPARHQLPLLVGTISAAVAAAALLDANLRNSSVGDWLHIILLGTLLVALVLGLLRR